MVNLTNNSVTFNSSSPTTFNITAFSKVYLQLHVDCNVENLDVAYQSYINITNTTPFNSALFNMIPSGIFAINTTNTETINSTTGLVRLSNNYSGSSFIATSFRNYFGNLSITLPTQNSLVLLPLSALRNASFFLTVLDEETLQAIKYTLTISNSTNTTNYGTQSASFNANWTGIPNGIITLTYGNGTFYNPRTFTTTFNTYGTDLSTSFINNTIYLLRANANVSTITFFIKDPNGAAIQGATVTIQRLINGVYQTVCSGTTDSVGSYATALSTLTQYQILVSASGYLPFSTQLTPTQPTYTLYLSSGNQGNDTNFGANITFTPSPLNPFLSNASGDLVTIAVNVTSLNPIIASYGFNFTIDNGTTLCSSFLNSSLGGYSSCTLNISNLTGGGIGVFWYNRTDLNGTIQLKIAYTIGESNTGFVYSARLINIYWPSWSKFVFSIILSMMASIAVSRYLGFGSVIVTIATLGICTAAGLFDPIIYAIIFLLAVAMIITGRLNI